jgi:hypothetical protein
MEVWKKFSNIEVSNMGNLKTRQHKDGNYRGSADKDGYMKVGVNKKTYQVHRLVSHLFNDVALDDPRQVDHINGIKDDNRIENLRMVSSRENHQNLQSHRNGGLVGSSCDKRCNMWVSQIKINGKNKYLGYFDTELEAHEAYIKALSE